MEQMKDRLRQARTDAKLTQDQLAKSRHVNKKQSLISNLEAGTYKGSPYLPEIAYALGVHAMWLKTGIGPKYIDPRRNLSSMQVNEPTTGAENYLAAVHPLPPPVDPVKAEIATNMDQMARDGLICLLERSRVLAAQYPAAKNHAS